MLLFSFFFSLLSWFTGVSVSENTEPANIYLSINNGKTWEGFAKGLPENLSIIDVLEHDNTIYLTAIGKGLYVLEKDSDAWVERNAGLPFILESDPFAKKTRRDYFPTSLAAQGERLVIGSFDDGVFYSEDRGKSWHQAKTNIDDVVGALLFTDEGLIAGTHHGIWQSLDGGENWELRCETGFRVNVLALHNNQLHVARQNGMGILHGDNLDWSDMKTDWAIGQLFSEGDYLYAITAKNEVFRSKTGEVWENNKFAIKGLPATNFIDAIWGGFVPELPTKTQPGLITPTSRGWFVSANRGC